MLNNLVNPDKGYTTGHYTILSVLPQTKMFFLKLKKECIFVFHDRYLLSSFIGSPTTYKFLFVWDL